MLQFLLPLHSIAQATTTDSPPGSNLDSCQSSKPPVVLVHGTFGSQSTTWNNLSQILANSGRCVYSLNYGGIGDIYGVNDITKSANELGNFVNGVLAKTGATKVDLVGHSQGGMMPHLWIRDMGGAAKVNKFVALSPTNSGVNIGKLDSVASPELIALFCQACEQQIKGSLFMKSLRQRPLVVPGVQYTVITSIYDAVIAPVRSQFLNGPNVRNILLQTRCPLNTVGHTDITSDNRTIGFILQELNGQGSPIVCQPTATAL